MKNRLNEGPDPEYSNELDRFRESINESAQEFNEIVKSNNPVVLSSNPQKAFWMLSDGSLIGEGDQESFFSHSDFSLEGIDGFYHTVNEAFFENGSIRIWADERFPGSNYALEIRKSPTKEQKKALGELISNLPKNKKVEIEAKKNGQNFFRTKEARLFGFVLDDIEDFYSRKGGSKSKVQRFRESVRREIKRVINEVSFEGYWIDRFGERLDVRSTHRDAATKNLRRFLTDDQIERIHEESEMARLPKEYVLKDNMDLVYKNGAIAVRHYPNKSKLVIRGKRSAISNHLDDIIVDNPKFKYTVQMTDENGEYEKSFYKLSLEDFMQKFSGRDKSGGSSKLSRFRGGR